jgi:alpha-D-xyloside xylohydrolase
VRAGSIVPTGPAIQYTSEDTGSVITLNVYTGADGSSSVYNDDGVSRQYLNGHFSRIPLRWDEKTHILWIGPRDGSGYEGMPATRKISIRWIKPGTPLSFTATPDVSVVYDSKPLSVRMR